MARVIDEKGLGVQAEDLTSFDGVGDAKATLILAAIEFVAETGNEVIITLPEVMMDAVAGKTGTRIVR